MTAAAARMLIQAVVSKPALEASMNWAAGAALKGGQSAGKNFMEGLAPKQNDFKAFEKFGQMMQREIPAMMADVGEAAATSMMRGLSAFKSGDVQGVFESVQDAMSSAVDVGTEVGQTFAQLAGRWAPMLEGAIGALGQTMGTFVQVGGDYLQLIVEIGDKYSSLTRTLSESTIDMKQIAPLQGMVRDIMGSGAIDTFEDVSTTIGRFARTMNLAGPELRAFTTSYAALAEMIGSQNAVDIAGIMKAYNVSYEDSADEMTKLGNITRGLGGDAGRLIDAMIRSGPAMRNLGYDASSTALLFAGMNAEGLRGTKLVYGMGQLVDKVGDAAQRGLFGTYLQDADKEMGQLAGQTLTTADAFKILMADVKRLMDLGTQQGRDAAYALLSNYTTPQNATLMAELIQKQAITSPEALKAATEGYKQDLTEVAAETADLANQFSNATQTFQAMLAPIGLAFAEAIGGKLAQFTQWMSENQNVVQEWGLNVAEVVMTGFQYIGNFAAEIITYVGHIADGVTMTMGVVLQPFVSALQIVFDLLEHLPTFLGGRVFDDAKSLFDGADKILSAMRETDISSGTDFVADKIAAGAAKIPQAIESLQEVAARELRAQKIEAAFVVEKTDQPGSTGFGYKGIEYTKAGEEDPLNQPNLEIRPENAAEVTEKLAKLGIDLVFKQGTTMVDKVIAHSQEAVQMWEEWYRSEVTKKKVTMGIPVQYTEPDGTPIKGVGDGLKEQNKPLDIKATITPTGVTPGASLPGGVGAAAAAPPPPPTPLYTSSYPVGSGGFGAPGTYGGAAAAAPSGGGGGVGGNAAREFAHASMVAFWEQQGLKATDYHPAAGTPQEHQQGALDVWPSLPATVNPEPGDKIVQQALADPNVYGIIWNNQIYGYGHGPQARPYESGFTGDITQDHKDHVHIWYRPGRTDNIATAVTSTAAQPAMPATTIPAAAPPATTIPAAPAPSPVVSGAPTSGPGTSGGMLDGAQRKYWTVEANGAIVWRDEAGNPTAPPAGQPGEAAKTPPPSDWDDRPAASWGPPVTAESPATAESPFAAVKTSADLAAFSKTSAWLAATQAERDSLLKQVIDTANKESNAARVKAETAEKFKRAAEEAEKTEATKRQAAEQAAQTAAQEAARTAPVQQTAPVKDFIESVGGTDQFPIASGSGTSLVPGGRDIRPSGEVPWSQNPSRVPIVDRPFVDDKTKTWPTWWENTFGQTGAATAVETIKGWGSSIFGGVKRVFENAQENVRAEEAGAAARRDALLKPIENMRNQIQQETGQPWSESDSLFGGATAKASGGPVFGAGTATSDSIPAWLSNGEFVQNAAAVSHYGTDFMHAVNMKKLPKLAGGGSVDTRGAQVNTIGLAQDMSDIVPVSDIHLYRGPDKYNEHSSGQAADLMVSALGKHAVGPEKGRGDFINQAALKLADKFGVMYTIWQNKLWYPGGGVKKYGQDPSLATQGHYDHVHVRTTGGGYPEFGGVGPQGQAEPGGKIPAGMSDVPALGSRQSTKINFADGGLASFEEGGLVDLQKELLRSAFQQKPPSAEAKAAADAAEWISLSGMVGSDLFRNSSTMPRYEEGGLVELQKELLRSAFQQKPPSPEAVAAADLAESMSRERQASTGSKSGLAAIGDFLGGEEGGWKDKLSKGVANALSGSFWLEKGGVDTSTEKWNERAFNIPMISDVMGLVSRIAGGDGNGALSPKDMVDFFALPDAQQEMGVIASGDTSIGQKGISALAMAGLVPGLGKVAGKLSDAARAADIAGPGIVRLPIDLLDNYAEKGKPSGALVKEMGQKIEGGIDTTLELGVTPFDGLLMNDWKRGDAKARLSAARILGLTDYPVVIDEVAERSIAEYLGSIKTVGTPHTKEYVEAVYAARQASAHAELLKRAQGLRPLPPGTEFRFLEGGGFPGDENNLFAWLGIDGKPAPGVAAYDALVAAGKNPYYTGQPGNVGAADGWLRTYNDKILSPYDADPNIPRGPSGLHRPGEIAMINSYVSGVGMGTRLVEQALTNPLSVMADIAHSAELLPDGQRFAGQFGWHPRVIESTRGTFPGDSDGFNNGYPELPYLPRLDVQDRRLFPGWKAGGAIKRASGGSVFGAGSSTSDSIPAWLSNGEFVQNADAVAHYGTDFMHAVNSRKLPVPKFAPGGLVDDDGQYVTAENGVKIPLELWNRVDPFSPPGMTGRTSPIILGSTSPDNNPWINPPKDPKELEAAILGVIAAQVSRISSERSGQELLDAQQDIKDQIADTTAKMQEAYNEWLPQQQNIDFLRANAATVAETQEDEAAASKEKYDALVEQLGQLNKNLDQNKQAVDDNARARSLTDEKGYELKKQTQTYKSDKDAESLGRGLVEGLFEGFGFDGDLFGKAFTEWGSWKLATGLAGFGLNLAQATGAMPAPGAAGLGPGTGVSALFGAAQSTLPGVASQLPQIQSNPDAASAASVTPALTQSQPPAGGGMFNTNTGGGPLPGPQQINNFNGLDAGGVKSAVENTTHGMAAMSAPMPVSVG